MAARTKAEAAHGIAEHARELLSKHGVKGAEVFGIDAEGTHVVITYRHDGKLYEGYVVGNGKSEKLVIASGWG